ICRPPGGSPPWPPPTLLKSTAPRPTPTPAPSSRRAIETVLAWTLRSRRSETDERISHRNVWRRTLRVLPVGRTYRPRPRRLRRSAHLQVHPDRTRICVEAPERWG